MLAGYLHFNILMQTLTPWALSACAELADLGKAHVSWNFNGYTFAVHNTADSLWIVVKLPKGGRMNFRAAYAPGDSLSVTVVGKSKFVAAIDLTSDTGQYKVKIELVQNQDYPVLKYTTSLKPTQNMTIPFWPRDIIATSTNGSAQNVKGIVHASQEGTRSGFMYMTMTQPKSGSVCYLQNLTALNAYCEQTKTSAGNVVGGNWPEMGFALPVTAEGSLEKDKEIIISDAIIAFDDQIPKNEACTIHQYLNMLAAVYLHIPKPETKYQNWPDILSKGLKDLQASPGCWSQVAGHHYLNAYVSDYETPPEIMVQLAVLLPLIDYAEWSGDNLDMMQTIKDGLPTFYNEELKTIMRWLPAAEDKLKGEEEQKAPLVMDSWYLHHPLLNLSRVALKGDQKAEELFLNSIEFAITVAHHFDYQWPVFYKMDTLEVIKAETSEGEGGEKDVAGLYAHVMLQAWELTGKKKFLNEAEKAAQTLTGLGFELFYQANNTAFASGALLRLHKITKKKRYLDLSYMCLAGLFRNTQLWECNYGYSKNFPTFFALFPLNDAPYTAVYEEQEVFCALHDYLKHAQGVDILPSVRLLIAEYIRNLVNRAVYYYPTMLPKEMLEEKSKVGELDPNLWIALEDLHDGWEKSGSVGQEVYGAGNAFGILPRHYLRVDNEQFMIYVDYPVAQMVTRAPKAIKFKVLGDPRLTCKLRIIKTNKPRLPEFTIWSNNSKTELQAKKVEGGSWEYEIVGDAQVTINW